MTVFIVAKSMPAVFGSSSTRIALCAPTVVGVTLIARVLPFLLVVIDVIPAGSENVPSLPIHESLNVPLSPENVYVRIYGASPTVTPSRS